MRSDVRHCATGDRLQDAARVMLQMGCDSLPVCGADGRLEGQLGASTIYQLVCVDGAPIQDLHVADAPVAESCICPAGTSVVEAHAMLARAGADSIYVVDERLTLVGVVGREALTKAAGLRDERIRWRNSGAERGDDGPYPGWTLIVGRKLLISPDGNSVSIQRNLLRLLLVFMQSPGETLSRDFLMKRICNRKWHQSDRYIDVLIGQLRRKFSDDPVGQHVIRTAYGSGYVFLLEVERGAELAPASELARPSPRMAQTEWATLF